MERDIGFIEKRYEQIENPYVAFARFNLQDMLLFGFYSPSILEQMLLQKDKIPYYILNNVPKDIVKLAEQKLPPEETEKKICSFYLDKAIEILERYSHCPIPMQPVYKDGEILLAEETEKEYIDTTTGLLVKPTYRDLLSESGHQRLEELKKARENGDLSKKIKDISIRSGNKFMLDTALFANLPGIDTLDKMKDNIKNIVVSATTGCYGNCSHCGYKASTKVRHMPYPVLLKIFEQLDLVEKPLSANVPPSENNGQKAPRRPPMIYSDSDPLSYYDPIIGADAGDFYFAQKNKNPYFSMPVVSKGLLHINREGLTEKQEAIAFGKLFENGTITLSWVKLPGENNEKNETRIKNTLWLSKKILTDYPDRISSDVESAPLEFRLMEKVPVSYISMEKMKENKPEGIPVVSENTPYANGRFKETIKKYNLPISTENPPNFFAGEALVFRTDGAICTTKNDPESKGDCKWDKIGDTFGKEEPRLKIGGICRLCRGKSITD